MWDDVIVIAACADGVQLKELLTVRIKFGRAARTRQGRYIAPERSEFK